MQITIDGEISFVADQVGELIHTISVERDTLRTKVTELEAEVKEAHKLTAISAVQNKKLLADQEAMQKALEKIVAHRGNIISKTYFECINIAELALKEDTPCEHDYKMELGRPICTKCGLQPEHPYF